MLSDETKTKFVMMRAEGKSHRAIAAALHISRNTCGSWDTMLKEKIAEQRADVLAKLYQTYYMTREARIKQLGKTLKAIDRALTAADLTKLSPDKLLDFKLKYMMLLKAEYIPLETEEDAEPLPDRRSPLSAFTTSELLQIAGIDTPIEEGEGRHD